MIKPPAKGLAVVLLVLAAGIAAEASGTADAALIAAIALAALTAITLAAGLAVRLYREATTAAPPRRGGEVPVIRMGSYRAEGARPISARRVIQGKPLGTVPRAIGEGARR